MEVAVYEFFSLRDNVGAYWHAQVMLQEVLMKCVWLNHWAFYLDMAPNSQEKLNVGAKLNLSFTEQLLVSICCAIILDL